MNDSITATWRLILGILLVVAGLVVVTVAYLNVRGESDVSRQIPYLVSGGIGGLALVLVGSSLWLSHGFVRHAKEIAHFRTELEEVRANQVEMSSTAPGKQMKAGRKRFSDVG